MRCSLIELARFLVAGMFPGGRKARYRISEFPNFAPKAIFAMLKLKTSLDVSAENGVQHND